MATHYAVPTAIMAQTKNLRLRESMMLGSSLEGGWNPPFGVGDNGTSFGPYQMHEGGALTSSGLTPQQAEDPSLSTKAMMPAYASAVNQISDQEWKNNPEQAAEQAAVIAEAPAQDYYTTDGVQTVNLHWTNTQRALKGKKSIGGMPTQTATTTSAPGDVFTAGLNGIIPGLGNFLSLFGVGTANSKIKDWMERGGLIIFGGLLVLVGIVIFAIPAAQKAGQLAVSSNRQLSAARNLGGAGAADAQRRQAIADRSLAIGEKNAETKRLRENRLDRAKAASTL